MEPVGLALGLAGVFRVCLDVVEKVDAYKDFGIESRSILAQFEAEKHLFRKWARDVGIGRHDLEIRHHAYLDDHGTALVVHKLMTSVHEVFQKTESTVSNFQRSGEAGKVRLLSDHSKFQKPETLASKVDKIGWSLRGKSRFTAQVKQFGELVQRLHSVVPPDGQQKSEMADDHESLTDVWFSKSQRILEDLQKQIKNETEREMNTWLDASWTSDLHDNFVRRRLDGTCEWIFNRPVFQDWRSPVFPNESAKLLWVNGPAGYGKTILCARVVQSLLLDPDSVVASYFFSSETANQGDPFVMVRAWISQVISQDDCAFDVACSKWDTKTAQKASGTEIVELFKAIAKSTPNYTFVVDGLDECVRQSDGGGPPNDSPSEVLGMIKHAISNTNTRILVVTREDAEIRSVCQPASDQSAGISQSEYKISVDDVQSDAIRFSRSMVDRKLTKKDENFRNDLSLKIVDRCDGMFLWVKMLEDQLRGGKNKTQLEAVIKQTPTGLDHLYDRNWTAIQNLPEPDRERSFSIMKWTIFFLRPLTILELTEALLIKDSNECCELVVGELPDAIDDEYISTELLGLCGSLLEARMTESKKDLGLMVLQPIHFSAKQYILRHIWLPGLQDMNERLLASYEAFESNILAKLCIRYLNYEYTWESASQRDEMQAGRAFREYATDWWYRHLHYSAVNYEEVNLLVNNLFRPGNKRWNEWRKWFDRMDWPALGASEEITNVNPLRFAVRLGIERTVLHLIEDVQLDVNHVDGLGRTALQEASAIGHISLVKLLLDKGADVSIPDKSGWLPLHLASHLGSLEVVKLLLDAGADITATYTDGWSALCGASAKGHAAIVELLLSMGSEIAITNSHGDTPLSLAAANGHAQVVKLLLDKNIFDPNTRNSAGETALTWAAHNGHELVVQLLLNRDDVDVNAKDADGETPLILAAHNGHEGIVQQLLGARNVDINVRDADGDTPLMWAAFRGHTAIAKLLLDSSDISANLKGVNGDTALILAARTGRTSIIKLLLNRDDVDVNCKNGTGKTPLAMAATSGHTAAVGLLLQRDAIDINVKDQYGKTPLMRAASNGHESIVHVLLGNDDIEIFAKDNGGYTSLSLAIYQGHGNIVQLLLQKDNTGINSKDCGGYVPLMVAASQGHETIVSFLLDKGANLNAIDNGGRSATFHAANHGHEKILQFLLEKVTTLDAGDGLRRSPLIFATALACNHDVRPLAFNPMINFKDGYNTTLLSVAARHGHIETVKLLLQFEKIDLTSRDRLGRTALSWARRAGHTEIASLLVDRYTQLNMSYEDGDNQIVIKRVASNQGRWLCDVCTFSIPETDIRYHCDICNMDDFDICRDCFRYGMRCFDASHLPKKIYPQHDQ